MATFLDIVNRVLRVNTVIGADDDDLTDFAKNLGAKKLDI